MNDRTGQGAGDAVDPLDLSDDELAQVIDVLGLSPHDNIVRSGDVFRLGDAGDLGDPGGNLGGLTDLGLDEDVSVDHNVLPGGLALQRARSSAASGIRVRPAGIPNRPAGIPAGQPSVPWSSVTVPNGPRGHG